MICDQEVLADLRQFLKTNANAMATPTGFGSVVPTSPVTPDPKQYIQAATDVGNRTLWVVCVLMALSSAAFYVMAMRVPVQKRFFHIITAFITTFAFLSYFAMATGDGVSLHPFQQSEGKHNTTRTYAREVYWARYVDWSVTTPLLLLDLCLLAGLNGASITVAVVADLIMVLTGLFAAFGTSGGQKWGWYAIACAAYLVVVYQLGYNGRYAVSSKDQKTKSFFTAIAGFTFILWTLYPIIWGVADGSRMANVDTEIVAYAILDVLAKPIFGFWLLITHDSMSRTSPSLEGFWAHGMQSEGTLRVGDERD